MAREIDALVRNYRSFGTRPFVRNWPNGSLMEELKRGSDGSVRYSSFFPTGGIASRYQYKPGEGTKLERFYADGKTELMLIEDDRITDYTSYWENGRKRAKFQKNRLNQRVFYDAIDKEGRRVYPQPK